MTTKVNFCNEIEISKLGISEQFRNRIKENKRYFVMIINHYELLRFYSHYYQFCLDFSPKNHSFDFI